MSFRTVTKTETFTEIENVTLRKGLQRFQRLDNVGVRAGIIEGISKDYDDGTSVVMVATVQHEGNETIPSRPWLSLAFDRNLPFMEAQMREAADKILFGRSTIGVAMALVGQQLKSMQTASLAQLDTPALKDTTIAAKRAARQSGRKPKSGYPAEQPLVETGHLLRQHVFVVEGD